MSRVVYVLVAVLAAASTPVVTSHSYAGTYFPDIDVPDALDCNTCQLIAGATADLVSNTTTLQALVNLTEWGCAVAFSTDSTLLAACDLLGGLGVDKLLPWADKELLSLAWTPLAFCATVRPRWRHGVWSWWRVVAGGDTPLFTCRCVSVVVWLCLWGWGWGCGCVAVALPVPVAASCFV